MEKLLIEELKRLAKDLPCDEKPLIEIYNLLPIGDMGEMSYLETAGQCILEVSSLVNDTFPNLAQGEKTAQKMRLLGKLLLLKANYLV
ncbi:MAG: hypothetical protein V1808_03390 [Candidatus Daviesbacteria bacterium]